MNLISDFISLLFPKVCFVCGMSLYPSEKILCTRCYIHLPSTNFYTDQNNPVSKVFWGRINLEQATALYYYKKGGSVQKLIHQLKYQGHKEIGIYLGQILGSQLLEYSEFQTIDTIVPIPLHKKKLKKRGFNQAESIAAGLAESMSKELELNSVYRVTESSTQTKKSRYKRWENVSDIFKLKNGHQLDGKHVLLVDDVITTGATMEACLQVMSRATNVKLSVAAIAFSSR